MGKIPWLFSSADGTWFQCQLTSWRLSNNAMTKMCIWVDDSMLILLKSIWLFDSVSDTRYHGHTIYKTLFKWTNKKNTTLCSTGSLPYSVCTIPSFPPFRVWHHAIIMSIFLRAAGLTDLKVPCYMIIIWKMFMNFLYTVLGLSDLGQNWVPLQCCSSIGRLSKKQPVFKRPWGSMLISYH